jgi:hypothetical protein
MGRWMASVLDGSASVPAVRFCVGDTVDVLNAFRLPKVEEVRRTATVERIGESAGEPLYWLSGGGVAHTARTLRLVRRAR